jgi:hypothetical protein
MDVMLESDIEVNTESEGQCQADQDDCNDTVQAYIGAEMYNKRMFPQGCPSYQKAFVKLFKVDKQKKMKLVATQFFSNRDGFGFILRNLTRGDYQI